MLSRHRPRSLPTSQGAELGTALIYLLPYYGFCVLAIVRAALRRHGSGREFRHVSLRIARSAGRTDRRPLAG